MVIIQPALREVIKEEMVRSEVFTEEYHAIAYFSQAPKLNLSEFQVIVRSETFSWLLKRFFEEHFAHLNGDPTSRDMSEKINVLVSSLRKQSLKSDMMDFAGLPNPTPERVQLCFDLGIPKVAQDAFRMALRNNDKEVVARLVESRDCARLLRPIDWTLNRLTPELEASVVRQSYDHFSQHQCPITCRSIEAARAFHEIGLLHKIDLRYFVMGEDYPARSPYTMYLDRLDFLHEFQDSLDFKSIVFGDAFYLILRQEFPDLAETFPPISDFANSIRGPNGKIEPSVIDYVCAHLRITRREAGRWISQTLTEAGV